MVLRACAVPRSNFWRQQYTQVSTALVVEIGGSRPLRVVYISRQLYIDDVSSKSPQLFAEKKHHYFKLSVPISGVQQRGERSGVVRFMRCPLSSCVKIEST